MAVATESRSALSCATKLAAIEVVRLPATVLSTLVRVVSATALPPAIEVEKPAGMTRAAWIFLARTSASASAWPAIGVIVAIVASPGWRRDWIRPVAIGPWSSSTTPIVK